MGEGEARGEVLALNLFYTYSLKVSWLISALAFTCSDNLSNWNIKRFFTEEQSKPKDHLSLPRG